MMEKLDETETRILRVVRRDPARWWFIYDVAEACNKEDPQAQIGERNLYPALRSLENNGFLESREETIEEQAIRVREEGYDSRAGRPRRLYKVSERGRKVPLSHSEEHDSSVGAIFGLKPAKS